MTNPSSDMVGKQDFSDGLPARRRFAAILAISLGTMVTSIDNGSVSLALPTLARELGVPPSEAVLVVTIFQLVLIMAVLPLSALGDRIGHRRLYQSGLMVFLSATLACLFCSTLPQLLAVRLFQSLGAAATFSVSAALVRSIYPRARLGSGLALNTIVASTSASLAPTLGGLVLSVANWHWLFALTIPIAAAALLAGRQALPESPRRETRFDMLGAALCAAMFGSGVGGLEAAVHGAGLIPFAALIICTIGFASAFVQRERGKAHPILPVDLLNQPLVALASIGALVANMGAMLLQLSLPFRLQQAYGLSPGEVGLVLASWPIAMMVVAPASGMLSDRLTPAWLCIIGMALACSGMVALAILPDTTPNHFDLVWRIILTAIGFGLYYSPNARQLIGAVPSHRAAAAGALAQTTRMTGQVLGSTITAALLAIHAGAGPASPLLGAASTLAVLLSSIAALKAFRATTGAP